MWYNHGHYASRWIFPALFSVEKSKKLHVKRFTDHLTTSNGHVWHNMSNMLHPPPVPAHLLLQSLIPLETSHLHSPPPPLPFCPSSSSPLPSSNSLPRTNPGGLSHRWVWVGHSCAWHCLKCLAPSSPSIIYHHICSQWVRIVKYGWLTYNINQYIVKVIWYVKVNRYRAAAVLYNTRTNMD